MRLFEDAKFLEEWDRFPSAYAISILAQEEYGKAFLVYLASKGSVPWTAGLQKALRNHQCKQFVALVMEYIERKDFLEQLNDPDRFCGASTLPDYVMDAIHIIVHEHIFDRHRDNWIDQNDRRIHPLANRIARGILDREKQSAFYVHIGSNSTIGRAPNMVTAEMCREEIARTERVSNVFWLHDGKVETRGSFDLRKIIATFQVLSGSMSVEEFNDKWWD